MRITEPTNNDYDNDVSDNCDHNFGTFDDFGIKMNKKYHIKCFTGVTRGSCSPPKFFYLIFAQWNVV